MLKCWKEEKARFLLRKLLCNMSFALGLYHRLPPSSRSIVASLRGYYLNWWRYDKETEKLVEQTLERDFWSEKQWQDWQNERLSYILHRAATQVPFYKNLWAERRKNGDKASWEYLENWTILEKQTLRLQASEFVAEDCSIPKMFHEHTSGTTGTSLDLWQKKATVKQWYAIFEARSRRWYGLSRNDRWAILGGQLIVPVQQQKKPYWVWNAGLNQLYMSVYHLSPDLIEDYLEAIVRYKVKYILGYSSALYSLAQAVLKQNYQRIKLEVAITNAEPLYDYQREAIETAFSCPVRETYGMAEIAAAAGECEKSNLHQWSDVGIIEIAESSKDENGVGDLICTGLINADMPLIRYRVGDRGSLSDEKCACGRSLPLVKKIEGRCDDVLYTAEGRQIGRLDTIFKNNLPILEAQIIQKSLKHLKVIYVPDANFDLSATEKLKGYLKERMGDIEVNFEQVSKIPRTNRGKFRAVICDLPQEERAELGQGK